ncbi:MAG: leucyl aminopeptidase [Dissulfurispiraceae bacterium]|jgi:leucyl aminopeptidase|nr:leucyl aminopeptidase [Dissulfurispiraceae bacterium]
MIKLKTIKADEAEVTTECLILPFFTDTKPSAYRGVDSASSGLISRLIKSGRFRADLKQTILLHTPGSSFDMLMLVGAGNKKEITAERLRQTGAAAVRQLDKQNISGLVFSASILDSINLKNEFSAAFYLIEGALLASYKFTNYKKNNKGKSSLKELSAITSLNPGELKYLRSAVTASLFARDLVNTPANELTPSAMASCARSLKSSGVNIRVIESKEAKKLGMNAFLSVGQGSRENPKFIIMEYKGGKGSPVVLIGKSVTFDSGGISLKPVEGMEKMKYDMAGGAAVLGVMKAAADLKLKVNIAAILPAVENLPGGRAFRPGDVIKAIDGSSIEVISTDAEGRLTLADAIGYAVKFLKPKALIDIATLTGACDIAFGAETAAMMGNNQELMTRIKKASDETFERVWEMPLFEEYSDYLSSDIADLKNSGRRSGSLMASGAFLKRFAGSVPWAHLDIAGTAWCEKEKPYIPKGATGMGARLLLKFVRDLEK